MPLDRGGYFDLTPLDVASPLRRKTELALELMGIEVESSHHEAAPSQHEIDLRYTDALTMADSLMTFRLVVKEVAVEAGYHATLMPKPLAGCNGSGMHINMSLFRGAQNVFHDANAPDEFSDLARCYCSNWVVCRGAFPGSAGVSPAPERSSESSTAARLVRARRPRSQEKHAAADDGYFETIETPALPGKAPPHTIRSEHYIAGLLKRARELTLFTNQWVNSYKRLVPGYEAPTAITWAMRNHADLIRVPAMKPGRETSRRVEYRSPDAACNPYLVFALLLAAGLDGIENNDELPPDGKSFDGKEDVLPLDLREAVQAAEASELARRVLGDTLLEKFLENKRMEWENYRAQIHQYELDRYLDIL